MLNHGLNHGVFLLLFKLISCPIHWIVCVSAYWISYLNFKAVLALRKTAHSAQTNKSIHFIWIVWSTLYVYISVDSWICGAMIAGFWCWFIDLGMQLFISILFEGGSLSILTILIDYLCKGSLSKGLFITLGWFNYICSLLDELGKLIRKKRLRALEIEVGSTKLEAYFDFLKRIVSCLSYIIGQCCYHYENKSTKNIRRTYIY